MSMIPRKPVQPLTARRPSGTAATVATTQRLPLTSRGGDRSQDKDNLGPSTTEGYSNVLSEQEQIELASWTDEVYYRGDNCPNKVPAPVEGGINFGFDDERGDYTITPRDHIMFRYEIISMLGKGSFGQVVRCLDHKTNTQVAVKIIRNKKRFHNQAQYEIKVLTHLRERDQEGKYGIIRMLDTFVFRNHVCLTYELLSMNLYEYMKLNGFHPMPLHVVKKIGASILISLAFMWRENIIHCDLKPENILLRQPNRTGVKVIDLGSACFENERLYSYIQSRFYRAPEVILGLPYSRRIDLWSYACVLCELAAGYPLFPGENEVEQLACIMETLDLPPAHLVQAGANSAKFFDIIDGVYVPKLVPNSRKKVRHPNTRSLAGFLNLPENDMFIDFVRLFLRWDPMERPPPEPAMRHPWICDAYVGVTPRMPTVPQTARPAASTARIAAVAPVVTQPSAATNQPMPPVTGGGGGSNATAVPTLPSIPGAKAPGTARKQQP